MTAATRSARLRARRKLGLKKFELWLDPIYVAELLVLTDHLAQEDVDDHDTLNGALEAYVRDQYSYQSPVVGILERESQSPQWKPNKLTVDDGPRQPGKTPHHSWGDMATDPPGSVMQDVQRVTASKS